MSALYAHIEPSDDPGFVWLKTSTTPNPERKPAMRVRRHELDSVLLMLLDAARADTYAPRDSSRNHTVEDSYGEANERNRR
jgi:hypothetical protein